MKVLWFTNTASLASSALNEQYAGGSWISSLEKQISRSSIIKLGVAFHYGTEGKSHFHIGKTEYFLIPRYLRKGKILKLWGRWSGLIEPDSLVNSYLEIVNEFKPDVIHIFGTEQAYGLIIPQLKIPVIIQIQGNLTMCSRKWFAGLSMLNILRFSSLKTLLLAYSLYHEYNLFARRAKRERRIFQYCKNFMGRTDWDKRLTLALSSNSMYFHCDELLREEFYDVTWLNPPVERIVLFSTLSSTTYKGLETALETAAILRKKYMLRFEWRIAGMSGKEEIIKIIERTFKLRFDDQSICFKGSLDAEGLLQHMMNSNIFVHPSHIENSSNSVCEAMLIGMPIIATFAGGTPSIIQDKKDGLLVQDGDPYAMAGAIIELIEDRAYAESLGLNARSVALERHDPDKILNDVQDIYSCVYSKDLDLSLK